MCSSSYWFRLSFSRRSLKKRASSWSRSRTDITPDSTTGSTVPNPPTSQPYDGSITARWPRRWACLSFTPQIRWGITSQTIPNFPISAILCVGHFEFCREMLYFTNALAYHYKTWYVSSTECPEGTQKVLRQCHVLVKMK